jgi:hypothetical protein
MIVIDKKAIAIGLIALAVSQSAMAGTTTPTPRPVIRDHRGEDTPKYVRPLIPPGARRDPGWGNYGPKKGTGDVIVRDHRH